MRKPLRIEAAAGEGLAGKGGSSEFVLGWFASVTRNFLTILLSLLKVALVVMESFWRWLDTTIPCLEHPFPSTSQNPFPATAPQSAHHETKLQQLGDFVAVAYWCM